MNEHLKQHRSIDPEVFTWQQRQESLRVRARYIIFMLMNSETPPQTFADMVRTFIPTTKRILMN